MTPIETVTAFNNAINVRDIEALGALMAEGHVFVDSGNQTFAGKAQSLGVWKGFFEMFPDYRNHFEHIEEKGGEVLITGHSTCSHPELNGKALWRAKVLDGKVALWQVYEDTEENRKLLF